MVVLCYQLQWKCERGKKISWVNWNVKNGGLDVDDVRAVYLRMLRSRGGGCFKMIGTVVEGCFN